MAAVHPLVALRDILTGQSNVLEQVKNMAFVTAMRGAIFATYDNEEFRALAWNHDLVVKFEELNKLKDKAPRGQATAATRRKPTRQSTEQDQADSQARRKAKRRDTARAKAEGKAKDELQAAKAERKATKAERKATKVKGKAKAERKVKGVPKSKAK